MEKIDADHRSH